MFGGTAALSVMSYATALTTDGQRRQINTFTVLDKSYDLGLPGVCLDGPESHAHTDGAIYARLGFPACLNARSIDDYVAQAVRLIDDGDWREACRATAKAASIAEKFYEGDERLFCDAIHELTFGDGVE